MSSFTGISVLWTWLLAARSCLLHVVYGTQLGINEKVDVSQQIIEQLSSSLVEVLAILLPPRRDLGWRVSDIFDVGVVVAAGSCSVGGRCLIVHSSM